MREVSAVPGVSRMGTARSKVASRPIVHVRHPSSSGSYQLTKIVAFAEGHFKRQVTYDPNPGSSFSPLPPAFNLSSKGRKDQVLAGQRAEVDHILQPGYKSTSADGDSSSIAGPSRHSGTRTAGGLAGSKKLMANGIRSSSSLGSFKTPSSSGVYVDSSGKVHDTEFDPFAGVAEMSRRKSRRRSAFGNHKRRGRTSGSSSEGGSDGSPERGDGPAREGKDEGDTRKRLDMERRRLDEVSGLAAARRRSFLSDRSSGRGTPSIRSTEESHLDRAGGRSKSSQGYYVRSPLSPTFGGQTSSSSYATSRTLPTTVGNGDGRDEESPVTSTKISIGPDKKITITGFDAPRSETPTTAHPDSLKIPDTGPLSTMSRGSSDVSHRPKPAERPREELFPETPAQVKRREDRARRTGMSRGGSLGVDTVISAGGRGRILPEIEIVEDDDPRIVFPTDGRSTRVQTVHDHVIRGPFSSALEAHGMRRGSGDHQSSRSLVVGSGSKAPSTIIDEGGYLPSRWATGDRLLRQTEGEKEKYRPREWGGKKGELGGRPEGWK